MEKWIEDILKRPIEIGRPMPEENAILSDVPLIDDKRLTHVGESE